LRKARAANTPLPVPTAKPYLHWAATYRNIVWHSDTNKAYVWRNSSPITVYYRNNVADGFSLAAATNNARQKWANADSTFSTQLTNTQSGSGIEVLYDTRANLISAGFEAMGVADNGGYVFFGYTIFPSGNYRESTFSCEGSNYKVYQVTKAKIGIVPETSDKEKTLIHEFGHAFGWDGHTNNEDDLMYTQHASTNVTTPTSRDIAHLKQFYP